MIPQSHPPQSKLLPSLVPVTLCTEQCDLIICPRAHQALSSSSGCKGKDLSPQLAMGKLFNPLVPPCPHIQTPTWLQSPLPTQLCHITSGGLNDVSISHLSLCSGPWDSPHYAWILCRVSLRSPWGLEAATSTDTYQRLADDDNGFRRAYWELRGKITEKILGWGYPKMGWIQSFAKGHLMAKGEYFLSLC